MEFNVNAYNETFLTSNIAPQDHERWNLESIEQKIRFWADKYKGLYIYWWGFGAIPKDKAEIKLQPKQFTKLFTASE
jgi:endonuclease G